MQRTGAQRSMGVGLALIGTCIVALFVPLVLPLAIGRVLVFDDLGQFHLPLRYLFQSALRSGDSLLWSPAFYSGFPLFGEGQSGIAHPLHLLLYGLLPLGPAFNLEMIASYVALVVGTRRVLGRLSISREGAWFGAAAFTFSGYNLLHLMHLNIVAGIAHLPWVLLAADILLTSRDARSAGLAYAGVVALIASQSLVAHPQTLWLTAIIVSYWGLWRFAAGAPPARVLTLAAALVVGLFVGGIQLLPTLDMLRSSQRAQITPEARMDFSLEPPLILFFWAPRVIGSFLHETSVYDGVFATLAPIWIALRWRTLPNRALVFPLVGLAFVGLILALGPSGYVYPWISSLPGLSGFRAPARQIVLIHCAFAGLAAIAFDDLREASKRTQGLPWKRLAWLATPFVMSVCTLVGAAVRARQLSGNVDSRWQEVTLSWPLLANLAQAWPWTLIALVATVLMMLAARGRGWALSSLVVVALLDQGLWGFSYIYGYDGKNITTLASYASSAGVPRDAQPGDLVTGVPEKPYSVVFSGLRHLGVPNTLSLIPARPLNFSDSTPQRLAGLRYRVNRQGWRKVENSMPRARLVSHAEVTGNLEAGLAGIDISQTALVAEALPELSGAPGSAHVVVDRPGRIRMETTSSGRQLLIVTERFDEGWRASEDGAPDSAVRAYGDFIGVVVDPGNHVVELTFEPASFRRGIWVSALGLLLTLGGMWALLQTI